MPLPRRWLALLALALPAAASAASELVFIGTFTGKADPAAHSQGIYALRFDNETGALSAPTVAAEMFSPGFLALAPDHRHLYAVEERSAAYHGPGGGVSAFAIDRDSGHLTLVDRAGEGGFVHLVVDATQGMVIATDFGSGTMGTFPLRADGGIGAPTATLHDSGPLGPNPARQKGPHAHSVTLSPDNRFAFVCDLGLDRVFSYRLQPAEAAVVPNDPPFAVLPPGVGPRHSKFSPDGRSFYVVNEIGSSVSAFAYDAARGRLTLLQTLSAVPADFHGTNASAEIRVHPNGRFVYASNRGHDSLAVFARDPDTGRLTLVEIVPCGGQYPRNFNLSPDGRWLLCANRDSNDIAVFRVDGTTGRLTPTSATAHVGQPVCVVFCD
jgi:6-phosphogluconolactonase